MRDADGFDIEGMEEPLLPHGFCPNCDNKIYTYEKKKFYTCGLCRERLMTHHLRAKPSGQPVWKPLPSKPGVDGIVAKLRARGVDAEAFAKSGVQIGTSSLKLNDDVVRAIRREHKAGTSQSELSKKYGIYQGTISKVVNRVIWKDVADEP